jgi:hypothetical protein
MAQLGIWRNIARRLNKKLVSDEEQKVDASETDFAAPLPSGRWRRFLKDVEFFDGITAVATSLIALLTGTMRTLRGGS